jgi:hypothetical protein
MLLLLGRGMADREKPITIRGENKTILSIFVSENKVAFTVSRRTEAGFERIDRYTIPVDYILYKIFERSWRRFTSICEIVERLETETERVEDIPETGR